MSKAIKRAIAKRKEKKARRNLEKDSKYIVDDIDRISSAFKHHGILGHHCNGHDEDATEDDASSVSSFSTTATTDDNPGAGYTIDKYFYQPVGRRIEKIAFRIAMPLLSPFRICQYIEEHHFKGQLYYNPYAYQQNLINLKTVYLAGLDSLVYQTRSSSLRRSSAALSALIRLCPTDQNIRYFLYLVRNQIGHPSLAISMIDNATQEKKCYLFLMTLMREHHDLSRDGLRHGYNNNYTGIGRSHLRETLLKLVNAWRNPNKDAFAIMSEASLHFAQALYDEETLFRLDHSEDFELVYFFTIFIVRFIPFIYNNSTQNTCGQQTQQLCHMLLLTFLRWLDSVLSFVETELCLGTRRRCTRHVLHAKLAIDSLLLHDPVFATLLPVSASLMRVVKGLPESALPRNRRHRGEHLTITDTFIRPSIARTQRLLTSLDELEREIRDSMSRPIPEGSQMSYAKYNYTLSQARCVNVFQSEATEEFLRARNNAFWDGWWEYKLQCKARHEWGIYLRSNFDWDRDTTRCLKRLFELPEEAITPPAPIATVCLAGGKADTWNLSTEISLPKQMRVAYKSPTGETRYKTFISCPSSEDVVSTGELGQDAEVQDQTLTVKPEPRGERKEADDRLGHANYNAAPMPETESEFGVKQGEKEVPLIPGKPHSGAVEDAREELEAIVDEGGCNTLPAQETKEGAKGYSDGGDCTRDAGLEELLNNREAGPGQHHDQISICSVD